MISQEFDPVIVKVLCDTQFTMYKYPRCGKCEKYHKTQQPHVLKKGKVEVVKGIFFYINLGNLLARAYINQDAITL